MKLPKRLPPQVTDWLRAKARFSLRSEWSRVEHHPVTECYRCWAEVDLDALRQNLEQIRQLAGPNRRIMTVVKADAYGHGLRQIAAVLMQSGADLFGVANLTEARAIRSVGRGWPILMLGACLPQELEAVVRDDVMPTISSLEEAKAFASAAARLNRQARVHLKVDTGMGRLGAAPALALTLADAIRDASHLRLAGLFTHYSSAEDDAEFTQAQRQMFHETVDALRRAGHQFEWLHASNSGALLLEPDSICNTVRAGLLVYGVIAQGSRALDPVVTQRFGAALAWKCRVSLVRSVAANTPVSYGHTYRTTKPARLATITVGYGDGFPRSASNRAQVLIGGQRCPVLGRVTMDQTIVDVSASEVQPGGEVILVGQQGHEQITANELAGWCGTIPWEILTNITYRVPRIYRGSHAA